MHVENLKLFQNPAIYYLHYHENDVIIPGNLFFGHVRTLIGNSLSNFQNKHFLISKRSGHVTDNPLVDCFRKINII